MHGLGAVDFRIPLAPKYYGYSILAQSYEFFPHLAQLYNLDFTLSRILKGEFHSNFFTAELCLSMSDKSTLHNALLQFHYPIFHNLALKVLIWP